VLDLDLIPQLVVIAGPNGSGKSALFDAIRVFKEAHGGYSILNPTGNWAHMLLRQIGPVVTIGEMQGSITASIELSLAERAAVELPVDHDGILTGRVTLSAAKPSEEERARPDTSSEDYPYLYRLFGGHYHSQAHLGLMDHIGPERYSEMKDVTSLQFSSEQSEREMQSLLLNTRDKFSGVKSDLVMMHLIDMNERQAGVENPHNYIAGIRSIFEHFLPDRRFEGVRVPVDFSGPPQVLVKYGNIELDVSHLSSGEREILASYVHLEKMRLSSSIILFDEPELHLHPGLQRRVITHLHRLLQRGNNQIFLTTHSEEIAGSAEFESLFIMSGSGIPAIEPVQDRAGRIELLRQLGASIGLQLVSHRILFLEGQSDAELLPLLVNSLPAGVSLVDTNGKGTLMRLTDAAMKLLEEAIREGQFYLVRDHDIEDDPGALEELQEKYSGHFFAWDRYHIENYLLDDESIYRLLADDQDLHTPISVSHIGERLRVLADSRKNHVLAKRLEAKLNPTLRNRLRINPREGVQVSLLKAADARLRRTTALLDQKAMEEMYSHEHALLDTE
jgi:energy-coupling factor transporter ATP-binding protein EcfA2